MGDGSSNIRLKADAAEVITPVRLGQGAAAALSAALAHEVEEIKEEVEGEYPSIKLGVEAGLSRVIGDGLIGPFEAPTFYALAASLAGPDHVLRAEEASVEKLEAALEAMDEGSRDLDLAAALVKAKHPDLADYTERVRFLERTRFFLTRHEGDTDAHLFDDDEGPRQRLLKGLAEARRHLDELIKGMEHGLHLRRETLSFSTFSSVSNAYRLLGPSLADGEYQGIADLLGRMYRMRAGLAIFEDRIRTGRSLDPRAMSATARSYVDAFMSGPDGFYASLHFYFHGGGAACAACSRAVSEMKRAWLSMAASFGASDLASALAEVIAARQDEGAPEIGDIMPGPLTRWIVVRAIPFMDEIFSADNVALAAMGNVIGVMIAAGAWGRGAGVAFSSALGRSRIALPGLPLIVPRGAQVGRVARGAIGAANVAWEIGKFAVYLNMAEVIGGKGGREWAGRLFMFLGGAFAAFDGAWQAGLAGRLEGRGEDALLDAIALGQLPVRETWMTVRLLSARMGKDKFARLMASRRDALLRAEKEAQRAAAEAARRAARDAQRAERLRRDTDTALGGLRALAAANHGIVDREALLALEVRAHAPTAEDLRYARRLLDAAQKELSARMRAADRTARRGGRGLRTGEWWRSRGRGARKGGGASEPQRPAERPQRPEAGPPQLSAIQQCAASPPAVLDLNEITKLTEGKVTISNGARKALVDVYRENPRQRTTFWRLFEKLSTAPHAELVRTEVLKKLEQEKLWRARVGDWRLFFGRKNSNGNGARYDLVRIRHRGRIGGWGE